MSDRGTARSNWFERNPRKTIVVLVIISLLILDILAANVFKGVAGYPWWRSYEVVEHTYRIPSDEYSNDLGKRKSVDKARWGPIRYHVRTNSLGFKDKSVREVPLVSDKHRILFMGDSFTEGLGFDYEHTFVGIIDSALSPKGIEVLNAAVEGYSPITYWRKVKHLIEEVSLKFDDLVLFPDIFDVLEEPTRYLDDNGNVQAYFPRSFRTSDGVTKIVREAPEGKVNFLTSGGRLNRLKEWFRNNTIVSFTASKLLLHAAMRIVAPKSYEMNEGVTFWLLNLDSNQALYQEGLRRTEVYANKLFELLEQHHIRLYVAVYPQHDQVYYGDVHPMWVSFWQNWCRKRNIPLLDCFPLIVKGQTAEERRRIIDQYYIRGDVHFNANGHRLIADSFLKFFYNL